MKILDKVKPKEQQYISSPQLEEAPQDEKLGIIDWQANEFFYHPKNFLWYLQAIIATAVITIIPWLISKGNDYFTSIVILIGLVGLIFYSGRKPQKKSYSLSTSEISINQQVFKLASFSRYWIEKLPTHTQITIVGLKRTAMPITFYLEDKALEKKILAILRTKLPQSNPSNNPADWISRKVNL